MIIAQEESTPSAVLAKKRALFLVKGKLSDYMDR
jgi:hypothetical protein